jgi:hypothetical protein
MSDKKEVDLVVFAISRSKGELEEEEEEEIFGYVVELELEKCLKRDLSKTEEMFAKELQISPTKSLPLLALLLCVSNFSSNSENFSESKIVGCVM